VAVGGGGRRASDDRDAYAARATSAAGGLARGQLRRDRGGTSPWIGSFAFFAFLLNAPLTGSSSNVAAGPAAQRRDHPPGRLNT
jgi:hypothetical protein